MDPSTSPALPSPESFGLRDLTAFYRWHAQVYDLTRTFLLFGRKAAAECLDPRPRQLVLDVGCGTGVSLGRLAATGAQVVGIECTEAMRVRAQARVIRARLGGGILFDGRPYGSHAGYEGKVDRVLFSYSLSMIPPFEAVLERARRDLRAGGRIVVVDFLDALRPVASALGRSHVHLGGARLLALGRLFPQHRLRVVSLGLWRYFLFVGEVS